MTSDPFGRDDDRPEPATDTTDDERPIDDEDDDAALPEHLDLPIETPATDAIDQRRAAPFDDDME